MNGPLHDRHLIRSLFAANPAASNAEIGRLYTARTGREIDRGCVQRALVIPRSGIRYARPRKPKPSAVLAEAERRAKAIDAEREEIERRKAEVKAEGLRRFAEQGGPKHRDEFTPRVGRVRFGRRETRV